MQLKRGNPTTIIIIASIFSIITIITIHRQEKQWNLQAEAINMKNTKILLKIEFRTIYGWDYVSDLSFELFPFYELFAILL